MKKQKMLATLYSIQLSQVEQIRYVKAFVGEQSEDENTKGISVMSMSCEPEVFDKTVLKSYPCEVEIEYVNVRAGQNKMTQRVVGIQPVRSGA